MLRGCRRLARRKTRSCGVEWQNEWDWASTEISRSTTSNRIPPPHVQGQWAHWYSLDLAPDWTILLDDHRRRHWILHRRFHLLGNIHGTPSSSCRRTCSMAVFTSSFSLDISLFRASRISLFFLSNLHRLIPLHSWKSIMLDYSSHGSCCCPWIPHVYN